MKKVFSKFIQILLHWKWNYWCDIVWFEKLTKSNNVSNMRFCHIHWKKFIRESTAIKAEKLFNITKKVSKKNNLFISLRVSILKLKRFCFIIDLYLGEYLLIRNMVTIILASYFIRINTIHVWLVNTFYNFSPHTVSTKMKTW